MSGPDRTEITDAFDVAAADFELLGPHLWDPVSSAAVARADPRPGERVLDACCGTGASAVPTALRVGDEGRVDAVDVSAALVERLRRRAAAHPQLHPAVADVTAWTLDGYDLVQSVLGIFFLPQMAADTARLTRRARPGGRVAFTIWRHGAVAEAGQQCAEAVQQVLDVRWPQREPHPVEALGTPSAVGRWLTGLGLQHVDVYVEPRVVTMTEEVACLMITGSAFRAMLQQLSDPQLAEVGTRYLDAVTGTKLDATTLTGVCLLPS